ncbi:dihydrodipicolinate synthase family protein [Petroclostridium sp. X23]|uniref:dihydrodipicolinate synthase family protein n=1 Tax=Petroclostridium sp. X23 TaxID=3045146 RepID=UPI0024ADC49D|nr:dihydrodipicolinate synthase family protein [Petroclostridium sp. X23]WHH61733.1 dihydrodipicolinate synthase family protein [Petroclostridium sp. X23]
MKDTSCDIENIKDKLAKIQGTQLRLFNANTSTLLETLQLGASGFSGVMANFHPDLYTWITAEYNNQPEKAKKYKF